LQDVPPVYHTRIDEVLLAALAQSLLPWTGGRALLVDLEGHGREDLFPDLDVSRTVGWFTTVYPVLLELEPSAAPGAALKAIKEQLRQIPQHGIGYGLLRYLCADSATDVLRALPEPQISFNYLGQFDQVLAADSPFGPADESSGPARSPRSRRLHVIDISASVVESQLQITWSYSSGLHRQETIAALAQSCLSALRALIVHCQSPEAGGYTPSDFPLAQLSQDDLDQAFAEIFFEE
jgi:non-ribosomal peptide synthase protein (TIGR01720 family)